MEKHDIRRDIKTCVIITGTNGCGKSSVARALIELFGGIEAQEETKYGKATKTKGGAYFAGKYGEGKYGGVDSLQGTAVLPGMAEEVYAKSACFVAEGVYLHTFGKNVTTTLFQAERRLFVVLFGRAAVLNERIAGRSGRGVNADILRNQQQAIRTGKKMGENGVSTRYYDIEKYKSAEIAAKIYDWINGKH